MAGIRYIIKIACTPGADARDAFNALGALHGQQLNPIEIAARARGIHPLCLSIQLFGPDPDSGSAPKRTDRPKRPGPSGGLSKADALDDLMQRLADGRTIESQDALAADWHRPKQTVSDWMREWRRIGIIPAATPTGRRKATAPA